MERDERPRTRPQNTRTQLSLHSLVAGSGEDLTRISLVLQNTDLRCALCGSVSGFNPLQPAYDPLLKMAAGLERIDVVAAQELLKNRATLQPQRQEASKRLCELPIVP